MKNLDAGALRHRVTLNRLPDVSSRAQDTVGQQSLAFAPIGTYYALVECLGGAEAVNGKQLKGSLKWRVTLRASSGPILPSDQFVWNGHKLGVESATPDPFGILIEVECSEKVATQ